MAEQSAIGFVGLDSPHRPAIDAWQRLLGKRSPAGEVSLLAKRFKSTVYRLDGVGPGNTSVVAKYCQGETASHERIIYQQILPKLPLSSPRYYGYVAGPCEYDWLFLEYVQGEQYSRSRDDHAVLVAHWLGLLHSAAPEVTRAAWLPDRGPQHHLTLLLEARHKLQSNLPLLKLPARELDVIRAVISQCDFLESRWDRVEQSCSRMPRTLIHGDFKPRNVVIRTDGEKSSVLPFDWEASGWGVPTGDLAYIDLVPYFETVRRRWPGVTIEDVQAMKAIGRIFRGIEEFRWESEKFDPSWEVSTIKLQIYHARMAEAIEMTNWRG